MAIIAGTWTTGAAFQYASAAISGPACWAAGLIVEVGLIAGLSGAQSVFTPHRDSTSAYMAVLLAPVFLGLIALGVVRLSGSGKVLSRRRARPTLALTVHLAAFALAAWISSDRWHGVAWAMGGDARNHVLIMRAVLADGGLSVSELHTYPALVDGVAALVSGGGHRAGLAPGALMMHDAQAVAATYVLACIGLACMFVAVLLELLPSTVALSKNLSGATIVTVLACAATSTFPLVLGTSLVGGFLSAYGSLPLAVAAIVLAMRFSREPGPISLALLGPATIMTFFGWTLLAVVPGTLVLVSIATALARRGKLRLLNPAWCFAAALALGGVLTIGGGFLSQLTLFRATFVTPGSIQPPQPKVLYLLTIVLIAMVLVTPEPGLRRQYYGPLAVGLAATATVYWLGGLSGNTEVSYRTAKALYLFASCLLWIPFSVVLRIVQNKQGSSRRAARYSRFGPRRAWDLRSLGQAAACSLVVLIVISFGTSVKNQLTSARHGWSDPSAAIVAQTVQIGDQGAPFVFWDWSNDSNDRLGNFWAATIWSPIPVGVQTSREPVLPGGLVAWAYAESGALDDLCELVDGVPGLVVVTSDWNLSERLDTACPDTNVEVEQVPPPS